MRGGAARKGERAGACVRVCVCGPVSGKTLVKSTNVHGATRDTVFHQSNEEPNGDIPTHHNSKHIKCSKYINNMFET